MTPEQYCQKKIQASRSNFSFAFFFLSKQRHLGLNALYAFCREVDDIVDEERSKKDKKEKLNKWREEITLLFKKKPQHPVSRALLPHIEIFTLQEQYFIEIINGMEMDIDCNRYKNLDSLKRYCYKAASVVGLLSANIFGYTNNKTLNYAHDLGIALQLTNIIRDIEEDSKRGRIYIPLNLLKKHNVHEDDILHKFNHKQLIPLISELGIIANKFYLSAIKQLPNADRQSQGPGLIMANIYFVLLQHIIKKSKQEEINKKVSLSTYKKLNIAISTYFGKSWISNE